MQLDSKLSVASVTDEKGCVFNLYTEIEDYVFTEGCTYSFVLSMEFEQADYSNFSTSVHEKEPPASLTAIICWLVYVLDNYPAILTSTVTDSCLKWLDESLLSLYQHLIGSAPFGF